MGRKVIKASRYILIFILQQEYLLCMWLDRLISQFWLSQVGYVFIRNLESIISEVCSTIYVVSCSYQQNFQVRFRKCFQATFVTNSPPKTFFFIKQELVVVLIKTTKDEGLLIISNCTLQQCPQTRLVIIKCCFRYLIIYDV